MTDWQAIWWKLAWRQKQQPYPGAYHYYRPNENSLEQAALFIKTVSWRDLPPVLDIERLPENQSVDRLKIGLKDGW
jgi:lysozyme